MSNNLYGVRETPQSVLDEKAKDEVRGRARIGGKPFDHFNRDDLEFLFSADELAELEAVAQQYIDERAARIAREQQVDDIQRMTETVLAEWAAERRAKARQEALRRLGIAE